jgi:predicted membrane channel-forming protein YqfA (hemolysin III family)
MKDALNDVTPVKRRRIGPVLAWLLIAYFTGTMLFICSGVTAQHLAHRAAGNIGWILAGLSPAIAGIGYSLSMRRARSDRAQMIIFFLSCGLFLLCQFLGIALLHYALAGQRLQLRWP